MSAITTSSGTTCPSHQESAWGAAEARQERVIVEAVRKGSLAGRCWRFVEHICKCFLSVLPESEKASEMEQPRGASAKLPGRRPPPH